MSAFGRGFCCTFQGTDKTKFIIKSAAYQQHFTVGNNAAFQVVGLTMTGSSKPITGGGVSVSGAQSLIGAQDAIFTNNYFGSALTVYIAQKVHLR